MCSDDDNEHWDKGRGSGNSREFEHDTMDLDKAREHDWEQGHGSANWRHFQSETKELNQEREADWDHQGYGGGWKLQIWYRNDGVRRGART